MPSKPALENEQSCLQSRSVRWGGKREEKVSLVETGNQPPISGKMNISMKGICLGGATLLTEKSKAGLLTLYLLSRGSDFVHDLS